MIAWNDWMEITGYWWPQNAGKIMSRPLMKTHRKEHCSAIVATRLGHGGRQALPGP